MIDFNYETDFKLKQPKTWSDWLVEVINEENREEGELNYIFCDDAYLHELNVKYLNHDTLTDVITFDYAAGKRLHGDIYISVERILENAKDYNVTFEKELARVMVHGVLHLCGYKDKASADIIMMRAKEDHYISQLSEIEM